MLKVLMCLLVGTSLVGVVFAVYAFLAEKYPLPTESDYARRLCPLWEIYYCQKFAAPVRHAARGSGLEDYFRQVRRPDLKPLANRRTVALSAVGDLMARRDMIEPASPHLWDLVGPFVLGSDHCSGNLECAVNPACVIEQVVRFSVTPAHARRLLGDPRFGTFDLLYTANNHINDSHHAGIASTLSYLDTRGVSHVGASRTPGEQDSFPLVDVRGVKVAFLAYSFTHNGIPLDPGREYGVNLVRLNARDERDYDPSLIHRHISLARQRGADLVVASLHWGVEFEYYPPVRLVRRGHELLEAGVDIIVGHHPHILNPSEWYHTRDGRDTLCFYSLSNFTTCSLPFAIQHLSQAVRITVEEGTDMRSRRLVRPCAVRIMPVYFRRRMVHGTSDHRLVPLLSAAADVMSGRAPDWLTARDCRTLLRLEEEYRKYFLQQAFDYV